ncbi:hypothetical protein [Methylomicrobium sp. Wu6]|uniref:hypothetical protein n=1 Tax=Methylomicrobium sp. Wu6 TaxID=3107928 RepID=UPI002DD68025|nr:hypothetical protein [Methylomicrobium sp. Wu6]MEC4750018.1 hypothetical protein [Methylomicrobium sp. Wu6]
MAKMRTPNQETINATIAWLEDWAREIRARQKTNAFEHAEAFILEMAAARLKANPEILGLHFPKP